MPTSLRLAAAARHERAGLRTAFHNAALLALYALLAIASVVRDDDAIGPEDTRTSAHGRDDDARASGRARSRSA